MFYPQRRTCPYARSQHSANALHRLAAHCYARRFTQSNLRALQAPMSETTPGTEPPSPVSPHISDVSAQRKVRGVKRGQETMFGVLSPFAPVGGHRHSRPPQAAILRALRQGVFRLQRRTAVSAENFASAFGKAERALIACGEISCTAQQDLI